MSAYARTEVIRSGLRGRTVRLSAHGIVRHVRLRLVLAVALLAVMALGRLAFAITQEPNETGTKKQIVVDFGGGVTLKMILIPKGEYMMGSRESAADTAAFFNTIYHSNDLKAGFYEDEHPQHFVRITRPFYLAIYHITRGQFRQFIVDTDYKTDAEKGKIPGAWGWNPKTRQFGWNTEYCWRNTGFPQSDDHPVVNVSWNDAMAFCHWLTRKQGNVYRLPTEAEWEYACRAGTTTRYYSGDDPETLAKVGNVADATAKAQFPAWKRTIRASDGYVFTSPAGSFQPNAFGLYDMHGNAWQWCADWYGPYTKSPTADPIGPDSGDVHILRGGAWFYRPCIARSAGRFAHGPTGRNAVTGFRVARTQ